MYDLLQDPQSGRSAAGAASPSPSGAQGGLDGQHRPVVAMAPRGGAVSCSSMTTSAAPVLDRPDQDGPEIQHSVCVECWPDHETRPHRAACGQELPPGPVEDDPPDGLAGVCVVCVDVIRGRYGCGHDD